MRKPFPMAANDGTSPAHGHVDVIPADVDLPTRLREVYVGTGGGGTMRVTGADGVVANYTNIADGSVIAGYFDRIHATGTTVSGIVGRI